MRLLNILKRKNEFTFEEIQKMIEKGKDIGHVEEIVTNKGMYTGLYRISSKEKIRPIIDRMKSKSNVNSIIYSDVENQNFRSAKRDEFLNQNMKETRRDNFTNQDVEGTRRDNFANQNIERNTFVNQISGNGTYRNIGANKRNRQYYTPMGTQANYNIGRKSKDYWEIAK